MGTILVLWPPPQLLLLCSVPLWGVTLSEVVGWGGCAVVEQSNVSPVMPCMSFLCLEFASCYMHSANGNYFKMKLANGIREVFICLLAIHQCPSTTSHTSMCIVKIPLVLLLFSPSLLLYFFFLFSFFCSLIKHHVSIVLQGFVSPWSFPMGILVPNSLPAWSRRRGDLCLCVQLLAQ